MRRIFTSCAVLLLLALVASAMPIARRGDEAAAAGSSARRSAPHRHLGRHGAPGLASAKGELHSTHRDVRVEDVPVRLPPMRMSKEAADELRRQPISGRGLEAFEASATVLLHESLFSKMVNAVLPAVIADARNAQIPGKSESHFSYDTIKLSEFNIGSFTIGFASPNNVVISLKDLSLAVPDTHFDVFTRIIIKITCGGYFTVSVASTNIDITFEMTEQDGHLVVGDGTAAVTFGALNVYHHFDSFLCRVGQDIIQLFLGNIDNLIRNLVEKEISPIATKAINAIFAKMAAKIKIPLVAQPIATSDSIQLALNLLPPDSALAAARRHRQQQQPRQIAATSNFPSRDIEVFVTQSTVNALFGHFQQIGHLNVHDVLPVNTSIFRTLLPAAYNLCPDCPIEITTNFLNAPTAQFAGSATMGFTNLVAGLSAVNSTGATPILDLLLNGTFTALNFTISGVDENTIDFKIAIPTFTMSLYRSNIGPVDVSLIQGLVDFLLQNVAVPDFNKKFHGIPIPPIANVTVTDLELSFQQSADVGLDIIVPTF